MTHSPRAGALAAALSLLAVAGCMTPQHEPADPSAALMAALQDPATAWTMRTTYETLPIWLASADLDAALAGGAGESGAEGAGRRRATMLNVRLPEKGETSASGWYAARNEYDCDAGSYRTLAVVVSDGGTIAPEPVEDWEREFTQVIPHTPMTVLYDAVCGRDQSVARAERFTGSADAVAAHQAEMRRNALGY